MSHVLATHAGVIVDCPKCGQMNRVPFARVTEEATCGVCHADIPAVASPIEANSDLAFDMLVREAGMPVLVDFWAPWCGPCRMVAPEMEKVAAAAAGSYLVVKVNTENLQQTAAKYQISSIPALGVFVDGEEVGRTVGAQPASAIQQFVRQALDSAPTAARA